MGVAARETGGDLLAEPADLPGAGQGYRVFTPFSRAWSGMPVPAHAPAPERLQGPSLPGEGLARLPGGDPPLPAGPAAARARLAAFIRDGGADAYDRERDAPGHDATSHMSAYLRFGMCTAAQIGRALGLPAGISDGREAYWRQICWREFFHHHLARTPDVARRAYRENLRGIAWSLSLIHL